MEFRLANYDDIDGIMMIIDQAVERLGQQGVDQWQNGYPNRESIKGDIDDGNSYVGVENDRIAVSFCLQFGAEKNYDKIEGRWITDGKRYGIIHRIAVNEEFLGRGIGRIAMDYCESSCVEKGMKSIRIDTHKDNIPMNQMLIKRGYAYCGIIYTWDGSPRNGYEKILPIL